MDSSGNRVAPAPPPREALPDIFPTSQATSPEEHSQKHHAVAINFTGKQEGRPMRGSNDGQAGALPPIHEEGGLTRKLTKTLSLSKRSSITGDGNSDDTQKNSQAVNGAKVDSILSAAQRRGGLHSKLAGKLQEMDRDGNGIIDSNELVECIVQLVKEQEDRQFWFAFAMISVVTMLVTIGVIVGLSVVVAYRVKDTSVAGSVMTIKGTDQPVQVASSDFLLSNGALMSRPNGTNNISSSGGSGGGSMIGVSARLTTVSACPQDMSVSSLVHLDVLSMPLPGGSSTAYLKPSGFTLNATSLTFFTDLGDLTLEGGCSVVKGTAVDSLVARGLIPFSLTSGGGAGRRLLQWGSFSVSTKSLTDASADDSFFGRR